jgi:hypothetical protein
MGLWDSIKGVGKKVLGGIGDVAQKVAPLATFIPGVGTLASGLIGAGGGLLGQLNDEDPSVGGALKNAAIGGAWGYGGSKLIDKFAPNSWTGAGSNIPGVGTMSPAASGGQQYATTPEGIRYPTNLQPTTGGGGGGSAISGIGNFLTGGGEGGGQQKLLGLGLGGVGAFQNAQQATQARELTNEQIAMARAAQERQRMLQDQILASLGQKTQAPDLSSIFASQNPFAQQQPIQMEGRA